MRERVLDLSIVIPTHNRADLLERTLTSLSEMNVPANVSLEVVVVANACTDRTVDVGRRAGETAPFEVQVVEEPDPGLGPARNRALSEARGDVIAFLDDDVWVERDWAEALMSAANQLPARIFAGRVTLEWESSRPAWASAAVERLLSVNDLGAQGRELRSACVLVGTNFAIRRSVIHDVGTFQTELDRRGSDLLSGGESQLVSRALGAGHRMFYVPGMAVRHWIPRERATIEYLQKLARGRGRTRVALMRRSEVLRCARLAVAQTVVGGMGALNAWFSRNDVKRVASSLLCHRGLGALYGLCAKATGEAQK